MESTRYWLSYTTNWLLRYATFLDPQTLVLYMEISNSSQNQWVEKLILSRCLNGLNRIIPRWRRVGSINTDRQSNSKWYSVWVDYYRIPRDLTPHSSQSQLVLWPPISKQPVTCFSIITTIRNPRWASVLFVYSLEVVRFAVWIGG